MPATPRSEFLAGIKAELPILVGVIPFGMIYGVLALDSGIPPIPAQAMSAIVFAGSSQLIFSQLYGMGASWLVIAMTVAVVNLRHALYSASVSPYLRGLHPIWKCTLAYLLTDEAYAVSITHYQQDQMPLGHAQDYHRRNKHWFFLGAGLALWSTWQVSTLVGISLGAIIPSTWSLDFTLALTFIALLVPTLKDRPAVAAALSAGLIAVVAYALPYKFGLILAVLVGILVGLASEVVWKPKVVAEQVKYD